MLKIAEAYYSFVTQYTATRAMLSATTEDNLVYLPPSEPLDLPHGMVVYPSSVYDLVPVVCFMHLESILEDFLLQTLMLLYSANPQAIPDDRDEKIRYSDVIAAKSREELIERIIYKAVRGVPRTLDRMITEFRQFDIVFNRADLALPFFVEMGATRNLWAHRGGEVDREYLAKTENYWRMLNEGPPTEGTQRAITHSYSDEAMERSLALVGMIERHLQEHFPKTCVRDAEELEVWKRGRLYHLPEVSSDLEEALSDLDLEVISTSVSAFSTYLLGPDKFSGEEVEFYAEIASGGMSNRDGVGRTLMRVLAQIEKVAAEHQLRQDSGQVSVRLKGRGMVENDREIPWLQGRFTYGELAAVREENLQGAELLDVLDFSGPIFLDFTAVGPK